MRARHLRNHRGTASRLLTLPVILVILFFVMAILVVEYLEHSQKPSLSFVRDQVATSTSTSTTTVADVAKPVLDTVAYDAKMLFLAHVHSSTSTVSTSTATTTTGTSTKPLKRLWPAHAAYPNAGALLPFNRIVAYYGNFYATSMGVLGQYDPPTMLAKLRSTVAQWQEADPSTPVIPAIDYIAVTAQGSPGSDNMYRARMPGDQIEKAIDLAKQVNGIVFLEVQVGDSDLQSELPLLATYFKNPLVHLCIDPEFAMKKGVKPGRQIGSMDASDVNYAAQYLAQIVRDNDLPPKILVIHRFTEDMVTNYKQIKPLPEVQMVMDMDGWGPAAKKIGTYNAVVQDEPVQFTGFKLFYKNDLFAPSKGMMTPKQVLDLTPAPSYIQYQ